MRLYKLRRLLIAVGISELAGFIGAGFTAAAIPTWYAALEKPSLNPPSWVFGPTWLLLYLLMGIAAYLVWERGWEHIWVRHSIKLFAVQLVLNAAWSIIFFKYQNPGWALVDIVALWIAVVATIGAFAKHSRLAAALMIPYILWVSFATYLNYSIWMLNK